MVRGTSLCCARASLPLPMPLPAMRMRDIDAGLTGDFMIIFHRMMELLLTRFIAILIPFHEIE